MLTPAMPFQVFLSQSFPLLLFPPRALMPPCASVFGFTLMGSESGTLYTGVTNSIDKRVSEHKQHLVPGFTAKYGCTRLVFFEEYSDPRSAITREKQIKGWVRSKKIALIESMNPHWNDLAQHWGVQLCPPNRAINDM